MLGSKGYFWFFIVLLWGMIAPSAGVVRAVGARATVLRYQFREGSQFSVRIRRTVTTHVAADHPRFALTTVQQDSFTTTYTVERSYADRSYLLHARYRDLVISYHTSQKGPLEGRQSYDTSDFSRTLHLAADGTVLPGGQSFGNDYLPSEMNDPLLAFSFPRLPAGAVAPGTTWSSHLPLYQSLLPQAAIGLGPQLVVARLLALTAAGARIGEQSTTPLVLQRAGETGTGTESLTRTTVLARGAGVPLSQHTALEMSMRVRGPQASGTATISMVEDMAAVPNLPPARVPGVLVALATVTVGPAPESIALDEATDQAFVGDGDSNTVTILATASGKVVRTVRVGIGPRAMAMDPVRRQVLVVCGGSPASTYGSRPGRPGSLSILDAATGRLRHALRLGINPSTIAVDAAQARAYITDDQTGVLVVDLARGVLLPPIAMPAGAQPEGEPALDATHHRLYLLVRGTVGAAVIVDTARSRVQAVTPLPDASLEQLGYDARTGHLFVTSEEQGETVPGLGVLSTLDGASGRILHRERHFGTEPAHLVVVGQAGHVFVADSSSASLLLADAHTGRRLRSIPLLDGPYLLTLDEPAGRLYALGTRLSIVDVRSGAVLGYMPVGINPFGTVVDRRTGRVLVVNGGDNTVSIFALQAA